MLVEFLQWMKSINGALVNERTIDDLTDEEIEDLIKLAKESCFKLFDDQIINDFLFIEECEKRRNNGSNK